MIESGFYPRDTIETISHVLFDTVRVSAHTDFFVAPFSGLSKTREDTNMYLSRQLPAPQSFTVEAIWITCLDSEYPAKMLRGGLLTLMIGSKVYFERSPLGVVYAPRSVVDIMPKNVERPLYIAVNQDFALSLSWLDARKVQPLRFQARIRGNLYRPTE